MTCIPLRLGTENHIPDCILESSPRPDTPIDNLKNEWKARLTKWLGSEQSIIIRGVLPEERSANYLAIPGSNLSGVAEINLELYTTENPRDPSRIDVLGTGYRRLADLIPMGQFRFGIDPWGVPDGVGEPDVYLFWFDDPVIFRSFRLVIRHTNYISDQISDVNLRMLMLGNGIQFDNNYDYGSPISFVAPPQLVETSSGSMVPIRSHINRRQLSLKLPMMSNSDRATLSRMERQLEGRPFIVSAYPGRSVSAPWQFNEYNFLARLSEPLVYEHTFEDVHSVTLNLVET